MKLNHPFVNKLGGLLGSAAIRGWMGTLDFRAVLYDRTADPAAAGCRGQKIYLFWHEYILFPLFLRGHCNLAMLLSRHRDAEVLSHIGHHFGFDLVRGSTKRGGVAAIRELLAKSGQKHLAITPDGPRGPRRQMAPGPVYLASKLRLPLVLIGLGYDRPWRIGSWDRFAVPRPGSAARAIMTAEIPVPSDLDRAGIEHFRLKVEQLLNHLTEQAEAWAESGRRTAGQFRVVPQPAPRPLYRSKAR
ncbi:MAG: lysophospholipid acyltransferase family protein [Thermoguttaceae bacterium]